MAQVFTGDTLFKNSVGGVRAPGSTSYEDLRSSIMDTLMALPQDTVVRPGHTDPSTIGDEWEDNAFVRVWRGLDREGEEPCTAPWASPPRSSCWATTTTGATRRGCAGPTAATTSSRARKRRAHRVTLARGTATRRRGHRRRTRLARSARVGRLAAGQAARQLGTRAANVGRGDEGRRRALERRQVETAEQIVAALGTMKGAAMKLGQVMSFLDVGLVPEEYREEFQTKLAALRDAAPKVAFKDMRRSSRREHGERLDEVFADVRPGADRRRVDRPGLQGHACTTAATWRSRCSTRASPQPCAATCRTWA